MEALLYLHVAVTWAMVGLIWTVQIVVYPALAEVPPSSFLDHEASHQRRMSAVLAIFGPAEVITALLLFLFPGDLDRWLPFTAGAVLAVLWVATAVYYAPLHGRLLDGRDDARLRRLVRTNWLRTAGWTLRGGLVLAMLVLAS